LKLQVLYENKSDFYKKYWYNDPQTLDLLKSLKIHVMETQKGKLLFHFDGFKSTAQMGPNFVQVFYESENEKPKVHVTLQKLCDGKLEQNQISCFTIDTPHGKPPENFKLPACPQIYYYTLQSVKNVFKVRRGPHPLLWILFFALPILAGLSELL